MKTTYTQLGSKYLRWLVTWTGCMAAAMTCPLVRAAPKVSDTAPQVPGEPSLAVADKGIFSDLDARVQLAVPASATAESARAVIDSTHRILILYIDNWPTKVYPLSENAGQVTTVTSDQVGLGLMLRPGDRRELAPLILDRAGKVVHLAKDKTPWPGDRDGDGIPDPLDLLIGGKKTVLNRARYGAGYMAIDYPMGDVPREVGVCTDVIIRAARNAGLDLQQELHRDIGRAPRAYPMVKGAGNRNIDHRRVKTLLPYFQRKWQRLSPALDDPDNPLRPGDIVLMDTFPSRSGPDHIGIVSDRLGPSGRPLIINNWTDGTVTAEMDLLDWVPVTHRFRFPSK